MLSNRVYEAQMLAELTRKELYRDADRQRMALLLKRKVEKKHNRVVSFFLHEKVRVQESAGNRQQETA